MIIGASLAGSGEAGRVDRAEVRRGVGSLVA